MTKEINGICKTIVREIKDYYRQVENDVRQQTDEYLTTVKQQLETYETKVQSDYTEMTRFIDDKSNKITAEVKALTSTQVKTLEAEKDKQEMDKISMQSIRDFAQQLTDTGSDAEVMTHSKTLQTRIEEVQSLEPVFDTKITDITFTPGQTNMDVVLEFPKIPELKLSIKTKFIIAKTYRGPLDACFGSLKQERAYCPELICFQKKTRLDRQEWNICFSVKGTLWDIQCTDDGCILVVHGGKFCGDTVSVFSSTGQCKREISIEGGVRCITKVSNKKFVVTGKDKCCRLYSLSGQAIRCFGQGDMSDPRGVTSGRTECEVHVCDSSAQCICVYDMKYSQLVNRYPIPMCSKGLLCCAYHHGINAIIVSNFSAHCVYAVTPQGDVMFQYGVRGKSGSEDGQLSYPGGVCVDKFGNIFIADYSNNRVVILDSDGGFLCNILTMSDGIWRPVSVDVTNNGELVVGTGPGKIHTYKYIDYK
ncbi:E3 ubiquitin-protein ligase TRIM71-like [Lingula anatina]|uniref:E3 ubiquitin-protein ligase TRIM71-like n=1 Tax=Lingula anatina TaxID=7574 RepID=A0A1S3I7P0_LINAN|nr:E3 ubiquitin-protein ligase TRIM71-like [Lingula anatina]|eukprot:XP_013394277.2 E3 ubiquitin-protein ligase TRIM71-like [Lingula anatina]